MLSSAPFMAALPRFRREFTPASPGDCRTVFRYCSSCSACRRISPSAVASGGSGKSDDRCVQRFLRALTGLVEQPRELPLVGGRIPGRIHLRAGERQPQFAQLRSQVVETAHPSIEGRHVALHLVDGELRQHQRRQRYRQHGHALGAQGKAYPASSIPFRSALRSGIM